MKKKMQLSWFLTMFFVLFFSAWMGGLCEDSLSAKEKCVKGVNSTVSVSSTSHGSIQSKPNHPNQLQYNPDRILIKFSKGSTKEERYRIAASVNGEFKDINRNGKDDYFENVADGRLALIEFKVEKNLYMAGNAMSSLNRNPSVEYVEYDYYVTTQAIPNDPLFMEQWALNNIGQTGGTPGADIDAIEAWDTTTGSSSVIVAIIDTGLNYNHEDLAPNVWTNPDEIPGNGIDDDNNGYVDDIHGINVISGSGDPMDDNGHGSHCAGSIGAVGNNGKGITGVNWRVKMIGLKFLNSSGGGFVSDAIKCIDYAVNLKNKGINIRVLNNSWGGGAFSQAVEDAIFSSYNAGMLFSTVSGNSGVNSDDFPFYPGAYDVPNIIVVAATDDKDELGLYSNYGARSVDMAAPGDKILSTRLDNQYGYDSGTSMAAPFVSGAAALLLSLNNDLTPEELIRILMDTGDPLPALEGKTVSGKRLNLKNAVDEVQPPPPGFRLRANPVYQTINQGGTAQYTINIVPVEGFSGLVTLRAQPDRRLNATITLNPNPVPVGSSSVLTIVTNDQTAPGDYNIIITGTSGSITKSIIVRLKVWPKNTITKTYENTTPQNIYDFESTDSDIYVPDHIYVLSVSVHVHITHTFIGDLIVFLTSPSGRYVILHNAEGGAADNIIKTYQVSEFNEEDAHGKWTLTVYDYSAGDEGTLDYWTLSITGLMIKETVTISGNVGVPGAIMRFNSPDTKPVISDANGNYSFTVPTHWSGVIIPFKRGYTFTPVNRNYNDVLIDLPNQDFVAIQNDSK